MSIILIDTFPREYLDNCIDFNQQLFNFIELSISSNSYFFEKENSEHFTKTWEIFKSTESLLNKLKELKNTLY